MSVQAPVNPLEPTDEATPHRGRRWLLARAGVAGGAIAATAVLGGGAAEAATTMRTLPIYLAISWRYDPRTKRTLVTRARKTKIRVRVVHSAYYQLNSRRVWVRIPYVWDARHRALIFSRALQIALTPKPKPKPKPVPPKVNPAAPSTGPVYGAAVPASPYVSNSMAWHLARRATYGPNRQVLAEIGTTQASMTAWLDRQLNPASIPDPVCDAVLAKLPPQIFYSVSAASYALDQGDIDGYSLQFAVGKAHIARALWSKRHLLTVMEDFWGNHFNVPLLQDSTNTHRAAYQNMLRAGALGKFSTLLWNVTSHPAMLTSLGNRYSDKGHPNENQGRELLELHTVGVDTPYGEAGVLNSTRILTGMGVDTTDETYKYHPSLHWYGSSTEPPTVRVLGFVDANTPPPSGVDGTDAVAQRYVNYLAHHPDTAHRIATKLVTHFVTDDPFNPTQPAYAALVNRLAAVYLYCDTAIAPVLRTLFTSSQFVYSAGAKIQRPFERLVATGRVMEYLPDVVVVDPDANKANDGTKSLQAMFYQADSAGHAPFKWPTPDGYPDVASAWLSTAATLNSWNNRYSVVSGYPSTFTVRDRDGAIKGVTTQVMNNGRNINACVNSMLPPVLPATNGAVVYAIGLRLFGLNLQPAEVAAVCTMLGVTPDSTPTGSGVLHKDGPTTYQLNQLIAVLLDSPYGLQR